MTGDGTRLVAAGEAIRRGGASDVKFAEEDARAFLASIDVDVESRRLSQAVDAAIEAALADTEAERAAHVASALAALASRDRIESALVACEAVAMGELANALAEARASIARVDRASRGGAAMLASLNDARRRERDRLAGEHRTRAWWWSSRAECDAMAALLRGEAAESHPHVASCADCARDRERMATADAPPLRHVTADELWSFDVGAMAKDERRRVERHAARCAECKRALDALAAGEDAIDGATEPPPRDDDVVAEHAAFVVRSRRDAKRVRFVVEPRGATALTAASLAGAGRARKTERGLELSIAASAARGRVALVVETASGAIEIEIDLARRR